MTEIEITRAIIIIALYLSVAALSLFLLTGKYSGIILSAIGALCLLIFIPAGSIPGYSFGAGIVLEGFILFFYRLKEKREKYSLIKDKVSYESGNQMTILKDDLGRNLSEINGMIKAYSGKVDTLFFSSLELNSKVNKTYEDWQQLMDSIEGIDTEVDKQDKVVELDILKQQELYRKLESLMETVHNAGEINKVLKDNAEMGKSGLNTVSESNKKFFNYQKKMTAINKLILDIAVRTHILSLNASIEATKAGNYGHGFSIVAAEVRRLADETRRQSGEINNLISGMNTEIDVSIHVMDDVYNNLMMILEGIEKSYPVITGIGEAMTQIMEGGKLTRENIRSLKQGMFLIKENTEKEGKIARDYYNTFISLKDYFIMLAKTIDELKDYNQKSFNFLKNIDFLKDSPKMEG